MENGYQHRLFYIDAKLGRDYVRFIPMYTDEEHVIQEKEIMLYMINQVKTLSWAEMDEALVLKFKGKLSDIYRFILTTMPNNTFTFDYDSYKRVINKQKR